MNTDIVQFARRPTTYGAAVGYASLGMSVMPCRGKKPALYNWLHLQSRCADLTTINRWNDAKLFGNVGIICGAVSSNLVVIDCDGIGAVNAFEREFPQLMNTYTVVSGSGQGAHFYYRVHSLPPTTRGMGLPGMTGQLVNIELRANGCYVIAPPSIHPDTGDRYGIAEEVSIMQLTHMHDVVEWIKSLIAVKHDGVMPAPTLARTAQPVGNSSAYGRAALAGECARVRMAPVKSRNTTLYLAALKLGSLIADGRLDRGTVERDLAAAAFALAQDDGEQSVVNTIASGLNQGVQSSRDRHTTTRA